MERDAANSVIKMAQKDFNSHAHVERDLLQRQKLYQYFHFNSHAHVERDGVFEIFVKFFTNFNSHAHVERDYNLPLFISSPFISTHTLTWSVTQDVCQ